MEAVACRTLKINIVFIVALRVHVTKYIYGQQLYEETDICIAKWEAVACRTLKTIVMFTAVVLVHVTKYIYGQHLYKKADACTAKWKLWRAGL